MINNSRDTGVYVIRCLVNDFVYIGSASSKKGFRGRLIMHLWQLGKNNHHSPILQNHFNKYGRDAFVFEIIVICPPSECSNLEQALIDERGIGNPNKSYNINPFVYSYIDRKHRIDKSLPKREVSLETRKKLSEANKGKVVSEETRRKLSEANRGRKCTPEEIAKRVAAQTGKKRSPEFCEKMRLISLANPLSAETRMRIAEKVTIANSKQFIATTPDGEEILVTNLSKFCRENNLTTACMNKCAHGIEPTAKGWKCRHAHVTREEQEATIAHLESQSQRCNKEYIVTSPNGIEYRTKTLSEFCRQHKLSAPSLYTASMGNIPSWKGWKCILANEPEEIRLKRLALPSRFGKYAITKPNGEEIRVENLPVFCRENDLDVSGLIKVARGKRSHYKQYKCRYAD